MDVFNRWDLSNDFDFMCEFEVVFIKSFCCYMFDSFMCIGMVIIWRCVNIVFFKVGEVGMVRVRVLFYGIIFVVFWVLVFVFYDYGNWGFECDIFFYIGLNDNKVGFILRCCDCVLIRMMVSDLRWWVVRFFVIVLWVLYMNLGLDGFFWDWDIRWEVVDDVVYIGIMVMRISG